MCELEDRMLEEIADDERWLAGFATPGPSPHAVADAKRAARRELGRVRGETRWRRWLGVLSAAAAIALAVGVGWRSMSWFEGSQPAIASADPLPAWVSQAIEESSTTFRELDLGVGELEQQAVDGSWQSGGAALYEAIEDAFTESDDSVSG